METLLLTGVQYRPVDELARALLSFKRPLLSADVMVGI